MNRGGKRQPPGSTQRLAGSARRPSMRTTTRLPAGVVSALRRGLALHAEGHAGKGLRSWTVSEARQMVDTGVISGEKQRRMRAWLARHGNAPMEVARRRRDPTSPARTAWELWGGDAAARWLRVPVIRP